MKPAFGALLLFVLVTAYMRPGLLIPIDWMDEGQIVYLIWGVALGGYSVPGFPTRVRTLDLLQWFPVPDIWQRSGGPARLVVGNQGRDLRDGIFHRPEDLRANLLNYRLRALRSVFGSRMGGSLDDSICELLRNGAVSRRRAGIPIV